jgi:hypothetical protein
MSVVKAESAKSYRHQAAISRFDALRGMAFPRPATAVAASYGQPGTRRKGGGTALL